MPTAQLVRTPWMGGGAQQAGVSVTVYETDGTTEATVYTDNSGNTTGTNPVVTDSSGVLVTHLAAGRYVLIDSRGERSEVTVAASGVDNTPPPTITGSRATDLATIVEAMLAAGAAKNLWVDGTTA
jgi:hypothetical protein